MCKWNHIIFVFFLSDLFHLAQCPPYPYMLLQIARLYSSSFFFFFYFWLYSSYDWVIFSSVQPLICVRLFATPWTAVCQASLSITNFQSLPTPMSIGLVMPSNHVILCCPLLLLHSIFPSIRVFSNDSALHIRWPKYWSFSFHISPSNEHPGLILHIVYKYHIFFYLFTYKWALMLLLYLSYCN